MFQKSISYEHLSVRIGHTAMFSTTMFLISGIYPVPGGLMDSWFSLLHWTMFLISGIYPVRLANKLVVQIVVLD